jgi:hypothetical protein
VRFGIDAAGEARDDGHACGGKVAAERARDVGAGGGAGSRADDGDGGRV